MEDTLIQFFLLAISIYLVGRITDLFSVDNLFTSIVAALVLALINVTLKPIFEFIFFPLTFLTFGVFALIINGLCLLITAKIVPKFKLHGCLTASIAALLISLVNALLLKIFY
ncbi:MAG: phage holin family protein [Candidatus Cloacimonetes bacterium]|nr:phage holin family protein [Candidatus Cloacimonadota bacterium]